MGRKKRGAPVKLNEAKRHCLAWNMLDLQHDVLVIDDNDPALLEEQQNSSSVNPTKSSNKKRILTYDDILHLSESSLCQLILHEKAQFKEKQWQCEMASFTLDIESQLIENIHFDDFFRLFVSHDGNNHIVSFKKLDGPSTSASASSSDDQNEAFAVKCSVPAKILSLLKEKAFVLEYGGVHEQKITVKIFLVDGLVKIQFGSEGIPNRKVNTSLQEVMSYFHGFNYPDYSGEKFTTKHSVDDLFEENRKRHQEHLVNIGVNPQHPSLRPRLRPYQREAVLWMLSREKFTQPDNNDEEHLHDLYQEFNAPDGQLLYYNRHGGLIVEEKPLAQPSLPGGILADEMGLGKTVEVLACMLCHPRLDLPPVEELAVAIEESDPVAECNMTPQLEEDVEENQEIKEVTPVKNEQKDNAVPLAEQFVLTGDDLKDVKPENEYKPETDLECATVVDGLNEDKLLSEEHGLLGTASAGGIDASNMLGVSEVVINNVSEGIEVENEVELTTDMDSCSDHNYARVTEISVASSDETVVNEPDCGLTDAIKCSVCGADASVEATALFPWGEPSAMPTISHIDFTCANCIQGRDNPISADGNEEASKKGKRKTRPKNTNSKGQKGGPSRRKKPDNKGGKSGGRKKAKTSLSKKKSRRKSKPKKNGEDDSSDVAEKKTTSKVKGRRISRPTYELVEEDLVAPTYFDVLSKPAPQKKLLECVCGAESHREDLIRVQCGMCGQWQHAQCVHYDLMDPFRGIYKCPHCHVASTPIPSGATLIVSPASISYQWVEEIKKHIHDKGVKMLVYEGVHKNGFIQPQTLANHDIVIVSYETLRKEIDYVDLPHSNSDEGRRFRHPKRFMAIPSPIVAVEWWRVCLDEAQMVECTTTKTAEMALRLTAVNRWCVTGTPIQRGIEDLFGLMLFLRIDPYWVHAWWRKLLYEPFCYGHKEPLYQVLKEVLWRTSKKHVIDQICLPAQTEAVHWLTFTPIEEHFYRSQYQRCSYQVNQSLRKCPGPDEMRLSTLDRYTLHMLLNPMTSLRQACCHPNAVRGDFKALNKANLTMEELLINMTKKARLECEEAHRQYVFANNALAALDLINNKTADAVEKYREVLRSTEEHKPEFRTDELQLLHTLHNLGEILQTKPVGIPPTLRDSELSSQCKGIKEKYLKKAAAFVKSTEEGLTPVAANVRQLLHEFKSNENWWLEILQWIQVAGLDEALILKVKDDLTENRNYEMDSMVHKFRDVRGLQYILATQLTDLQNSRDKVLKTVRLLSGEPSKDLVNRTTECCLRPVDPEFILKTCPFCKADEDFEHYENKLFFFTDKGITGAVEDEFENDENIKKATRFFVSTKRKGTWADSETESALKSLLSFAKSYSAERCLVQNGGLHMKILEELKKEYKNVHRVFMALKENVATYDELDMATTRLRLRLPDEPVPEIPQPNVLEPMELDAQRMKFNSDRIISTNELKKKLGQLLYLKNLAKTQGSLQGGKNPEPCPICQSCLGNRWSVLQCGHCFCLDCIEIMMERYPQFRGRNIGNLKCAVCRNLTPFGNISYVSTRTCDATEENVIKVKGDHSTKVVGVVRCLLEIQQTEPDAKCLVFSTWQAVLDILSRALDDNDITYKSLMAQSKFQKNLWNFKQSSSIQVLLLPVHSGSNGLNLIEATHVLLIEPILNSAQELQAIGRVHRIGQTRPTYVHRFIVKGTIENRMHRLLSTVQAPTNSHNSEETNMTLGDLKSLFEQAMTTFEDDRQTDSDGNTSREENPSDNQNTFDDNGTEIDANADRTDNADAPCQNPVAIASGSSDQPVTDISPPPEAAVSNAAIKTVSPNISAVSSGSSENAIETTPETALTLANIENISSTGEALVTDDPGYNHTTTVNSSADQVCELDVQ